MAWYLVFWRNRSTSTVVPAASASQALATINLGADLTGSDPNPNAGYPIVTFTWVLLYKSGNGAKLPRAKACNCIVVSAPARTPTATKPATFNFAPIASTPENAAVTIRRSPLSSM